MTAERERLQSQLAEVQDKLSGLEEGAELSTVKIKDLESGKAAVMQKLENTVR
jgi:ABC-type phosphate transport system auxiliary subunit